MSTQVDATSKAAVLIEALPYIQRFRDSTIVMKLGGSVLTDTSVFEGVLRDIVFLECVGARPVVLHGGGKDISARLQELGISSRFINGLRYTCEETLKVVDEVLHERVNPRLVDAINASGGRAAPVSGKGVFRAERLQSGVDLGRVGHVTGVEVAELKSLLASDRVPVVTPLAIDADGAAYNINADVSACRLAEALQAAKLVFLSDVPGVLRDAEDPSTLISTIHVDEVPDLISCGVIAGGMRPKIESAVAALAAGCGQVHLIDARLQHSILLEIFTDQGVGTQLIN